MEEKLRQKDTTIEKLRLKNSTIKAQIGKMEHMLAHKEEMGEVLHLVGARHCCDPVIISFRPHAPQAAPVLFKVSFPPKLARLTLTN
jgi:hypothetical protein